MDIIDDDYTIVMSNKIDALFSGWLLLWTKTLT